MTLRVQRFTEAECEAIIQRLDSRENGAVEDDSDGDQVTSREDWYKPDDDPLGFGRGRDWTGDPRFWSNAKWRAWEKWYRRRRG